MAGDIHRAGKDSQERQHSHETFGALARAWRNRERRSRAWLFHELGLALPPTVVVLAAFFGTQMLTAHPILFASLASSAFLIDHEPRHRMNRLRVMIAAQFLAAAIGTAATMIFGTDYIAGAVSMVITIVLLILLNIVHPPAVSTALGFSLLGPRYGALGAFLLALAIVAALAVLQVFAIWMLHRAEARSELDTSR
jgi:CBS-domain-containing membrane protein